MKLTIDEGQTRELRLAVDGRIESLKKLRKKTEQEGLSTSAIDERLEILRGIDGDPGLLDLLQDQVNVFEGAGGQQDAFISDEEMEEALEDEDEDEEWVDADYEIVGALPPPAEEEEEEDTEEEEEVLQD